MTSITIFRDVKTCTHPKFVDVKSIPDVIRTGGKDGKVKRIIERIRKSTNKDTISLLKEKLPCICFSGTFSYRNAKNLINHSGLICMDFDKMEQSELDRFYEQSKQDKYTRMVFISPSGKGLKVIVQIPADGKKHKKYFQALSKYYMDTYGVVADPSGKDVCRVCYASYDEGMFYNVDSELFDNIIKPTQKPKKVSLNMTEELMDEAKSLHTIAGWIDSEITFTDGQKHHHMVKFLFRCNSAGIHIESAISYYESNYPKDFVRRNAENIYSNHPSEFGKHPIKNTKSARIEAVKKENGGEMPQFLTFWKTSKNKQGYVSISFSRHKFLSWLKKGGFARYHSTINDWQLIFIKNNIVDKCSKSMLKDHVIRYIDTLPDVFDGIERERLIELMVKGSSNYFNNDGLEFLPAADISTHMDTSDTCWLYYKNTAVKITKEDNQLIPYTDIPHLIWSDQILDRYFNQAGPVINDFAEFIALVAGADRYGVESDKFKQRQRAFETTLGYLMHGYKNRAMAKAVILNDAFNPTDEPRGGTGKGVFLQALNHLKNIAIFNCKSWTPDKSFAFQQIQPSTQLAAFDDIKKNFDFEALFSIITEGFMVEKKGLESYKIPFELSAKLLILTNYPVKGEGSSHDRRRHELELDDFFISQPPNDYFGRRLFDDWEDDDWQSFDRYMVGCIRMFLILGLTELDTSNLEERRLKELTHPVFVEWFTSIIQPKHYALSDLHLQLGEYNSDFAKYSQIKVTKWIKRFADFYEMEWESKKMGTSQGIMFHQLGKFKLVEVGEVGGKLVKVG